MQKTFEMKKFNLILLLLFAFVGCTAQQDQMIFKSMGKIDYPLTLDEQIFWIQFSTVPFFIL